MKHAVWIWVVFVWAGCCGAEETIGVPWEEFKKLYHDSVVRAMMDSSARGRVRASHTVEEAAYRLSIGPDHAEGSVVVSGRTRGGGTGPLPLFSSGVIVARSGKMHGCSLVAREERTGRVSLLPSGKAEFQAELFFYVPFEEDETARVVSFDIPLSLRNSLVLAHPDDVRVIEAPGVVDRDGTRRFAPARSLRIRFEEVTDEKLEEEATPAAILDTVRFFTSFDESGGMLSILSMTVAKGNASRVMIKKIPDAEVWSLRVNGRKRKLFRQEDHWTVALARDRSSLVELVFLRKGSKLGLRGRLEAVLPEIGLPARELRVGLALPARVEMLSLEAPLTSARAEGWNIPKDFVGTGYFFSRSFYEGGGMTMKLDYREPVENTGGDR